MAATVALKLRDPDAVRFSRIVDITLDNAYPTGGYPFTPAQLGFGAGGTIDAFVLLQPVVDGYFGQWDMANSKLKFYQCAGAGAPGTELGASAAVLNGKVVRALIYGAGNQT
jgi:hypothetical protein